MKLIFILLSITLLTGCGYTNPAQNNTTSVINKGLATATAVPVREMEYLPNNPEQFNAIVSTSMRAGFPTVSINFSKPFPKETPPNGLNRWITAIKNTNGNIIICPKEKDTNDFSPSIIPWLIVLADIALDVWTFKPAENYNAVAFEDDRGIDRVEFHHRKGEPPC